jgi:hypothetical protein
VARVVILILLIPIGFLAHVGFILYVVFAIGSNLLISKNPDLVLRLERWAAPVALLFAKRSDDALPDREVAGDPPPDNSGAEGDLDRTWSSFGGRSHVIGTPVVVLGAIAAWSVALVALIGLVVPGSGKLGIGVALVLSAAIATWPTIVLVRRRRDRR